MLDTKAVRELADKFDAFTPTFHSPSDGLGAYLGDGFRHVRTKEVSNVLRSCADEIDDMTRAGDLLLEAAKEQQSTIDGLSMVIDTKLLDLEAKDREIKELQERVEMLIEALARSSKHRDALQTQCDTLRELVREAMELPVITASWRRSAEKALGN
jgi:chromosome segregation ATPase